MAHPKSVLNILVLIMLPCLGVRIYACQCSYPLPPCAEYWRAEAVFVGTVIEITPNLPATGHLPKHRIRFALERPYRGVKGSEVELTQHSTNCAFTFEKGGKYFVYAYRDREDNSLITSGCTGTHEFSPDSESLAYVHALAEGKSERAISGAILKQRTDPFAGAKVLIKGDGAKYETVSDKEGHFKVIVLKSGRYKVSVILPPRSNLIGAGEELQDIAKFEETDKSTTAIYEVNIGVRECAFIYVPLFLAKDGP
jgi:hypothetical protein